MALDRLTKVDGGGISTTSDYRVGIITASKFVGPFDGTGGNFSGVVTATSANFTGNVTIGGTLTYEDVTNIDSVGIITARDNIKIVTDNKRLSLGAGEDFRLYHDGTYNKIDNAGTTDLYITVNNYGEYAAKFKANNSVDLFYDGTKRFETTSSGVSVTGNVVASGHVMLADNLMIRLGTGNDFELRHTGSHNYINTQNGNIELRHTVGGANEPMLKAIPDGAVMLYHNGSTKLETKGYGIDITGGFITTGGSIVNDGGNIKFGNDSDLQIFHDNSNNINVIQCHNGRTLHIDKNNGAENMAKFIPDGAVELYHNNSKKLETTSSGTELTGQLQVLYNGATASSIDGTVDIRSVGGSALLVGSTNAQGALVKIDGAANGDGANGDYVRIRHMSNGVCYFDNLHTAREITFRQRGEIERLKITSVGHIEIPADNAYLRIGASADLELFHDNNGDSYITNDTGHLTIRNNTSGKVINLQPKSGANGVIVRYEGAAELYHNNSKRFETTSTGFDGSGSSFNLQTSDSGSVNLRLQNSSTGTGTNDGFLIQLDSNEDGYIWHRENQNIIFGTADATRWKITNAGHLVPGAPGSYDIGSTSLEIGSIYLGVNKKVFCGINQELELYTDGTDGYLKETNGDLYLQSTADDIIIRAADNISIQAQGGEYCINGNGNGSVDLYYDGGTYTTPKLSTTATGITVDGEVASSQDYPNFRPTTDFNFAKTKRLDPNIRYYRTGTASYTDEDGFIRVVGEGEPRFDHDPATKESLGLLIEESRTNMVNHSENLGYSTWSMNNAATRFKPTTEAPDGKTSDGGAMVDGNVQAGVWEIVETSSNSTHLIYQQLSGGNVSANTNYHISAFAKPGLNRTHFCLTEGNTLSATAIFDVANGTVTHTFGTGSPTAKISGPYGDGWYRCVLRYTTTASQSYINIQLGVAQNGTTNSYAGDGSSSIAVWGVQIERTGTSETSYIQNWGRNNTRGREYIEVQNPNERFPLTVVSETSTKEFNYARRPFAMSPLGATDTIRPFLNDSGDLVFFTSYNASSGYASHTQSETGLTVNVPFKYAYAISSTSVSSPDKSCVNGGTVKSSGNTTLSETKLTQYRIGYSTAGDAEREWMGHVRRFMIYDTFLSDGNLKTITS